MYLLAATALKVEEVAVRRCKRPRLVGGPDQQGLPMELRRRERDQRGRHPGNDADAVLCEILLTSYTLNLRKMETLMDQIFKTLVGNFSRTNFMSATVHAYANNKPNFVASNAYSNRLMEIGL
ncbi:hypothetical protein OsI_38838 [Oryza sativa Indica Group]|uniref:Uncharacterized protein n=1 Tax=Oryza sativa subsp. indica TaxID=39946 RepID=B8BMM7_ORYSI|nr:hypothetical protein OsI_38838 [Oryza sativa Indica Group]